MIDKKITIKDVAKKAGVAVSTVSNALNGSSLVKEETRKKILKIAEEMNYVPNINGRMLKSGRSKTLCFITSSIKGEYFGRLLDSVNEKCIEEGYGLEIVVTWHKEIIMNHMLGGHFDGFFLFEGERIAENEKQMLKKEGIVTVMLDRKYEDEKIGSVIFDSYKAGYEITKHLINLGHKKLAFVDSDDDNYDCVERKRGFFDALKENNISFDEKDLLKGLFDENISYAVISADMRKRKIYRENIPTAYVCGNDQSAIGTMRALIDLGYKIPKDISVTGFDNIQISQYFNPTLTTISNPIEIQGKMAVELMIDILDNKKDGYTRVLSGNIIPRQSTGICNSK